MDVSKVAEKKRKPDAQVIDAIGGPQRKKARTQAGGVVVGAQTSPSLGQGAPSVVYNNFGPVNVGYPAAKGPQQASRTAQTGRRKGGASPNNAAIVSKQQLAMTRGQGKKNVTASTASKANTPASKKEPAAKEGTAMSEWLFLSEPSKFTLGAIRNREIVFHHASSSITCPSTGPNVMMRISSTIHLGRAGSFDRCVRGLCRY